MEYADVLWDGCAESESDFLENVPYKVAKIVTRAIKGNSKYHLRQENVWEDIKTKRAIHKLSCYILRSLIMFVPVISLIFYPYKLVKEQLTPYEWQQITLFS